MDEKNREKLDTVSTDILSMYVSQLLKKHKLKNVPDEQKEQLRKLINDLKAQSDAFLKDMNKVTKVDDNRKSSEASNKTEPVEKPRRSILQRRKEEKAKKAQEDTNQE